MFGSHASSITKAQGKRKKHLNFIKKEISKKKHKSFDNKPRVYIFAVLFEKRAAFLCRQVH